MSKLKTLITGIILLALSTGCTSGVYTKLDSTVPRYGPFVAGMTREIAENSLGDPMITMWLDKNYYSSVYEFELERGASDSIAADFIDFVTFGMGVYIISPVDRIKGSKHLLTLVYTKNDEYSKNDLVAWVYESQSINEIYGRHWAEKSRFSIERGDWEEGITEASYAIAFNPGFDSPYINRAWAYCETGKYDKAIRDCNTALSINPNSASAYNNRGFAYEKKGNMQLAINDYNRACRLGLDKACNNLKRASATGLNISNSES